MEFPKFDFYGNFQIDYLKMYLYICLDDYINGPMRGDSLHEHIAYGEPFEEIAWSILPPKTVVPTLIS